MKKRNIYNPKNNLYYPMINLLLFIILFPLIGCFSIFRPTPILEDDKSQILKADIQFILLNEDLSSIKNPDFTFLDKKIKSLQKTKSFHELNNLAVYGLKLSYIETSEDILKKLQKEKPSEIVPFLNLLRIYYLLDEYEVCKKIINEYYKFHAGNKKKIFDVMAYLKNSNRVEEHVLFLDVLSNYQEHEMQALEELGLYFISVRDFDLAKPYFEKILTIYAYNPLALHSLMQIHFINESWADVITYSIPLKKEKIKRKDYYAMVAKAHYELGDYSLAIKESEEATDLDKASLDFLIVWRDSILCNHPQSSISKLNSYFQIVKKKNPSVNEDDFFITNTKEGKQILSNLINGT